MQKGLASLKVTISENKELVAKINKALESKRLKYGQRYCPCVLPTLHDEDHICMCNDFIENVPVGEYCHCGLYKKIEK